MFGTAIDDTTPIIAITVSSSKRLNPEFPLIVFSQEFIYQKPYTNLMP